MTEVPSVAPAAEAAGCCRDWGFRLAVAIGGAAVVARLAFGLHLPGPWYLTDEITYLEQARAVARHGDFFAQGLFGAGQPGWPTVLAPLFWALHGLPHAAYLAGIVLSTLLGALTSVPCYYVARRWLAPQESAAVAVLMIVLPGNCLYGWALLSEPLFTVLLMCTGAWFLRATETSRVTDWAGSAALAALTFWVRPMGVACIVALLAGAIVWGLMMRRRWAPIVACLSIAAVLGTGFAWKALSGQHPEGLTNYGHSTEFSVFHRTWGPLGSPAGWASLAWATGRDVAYLFVATLGVGLPLAVAGVVGETTRLRRLPPRELAALTAALVLVGATLAITGFARVGAAGLERMYGRYVEPVLPVVFLGGLMAWARLCGKPTARHAVLGVVFLLTVVLGVVLPPGETTFTNNPGFWYWHVLNQRLPVALALAVPLVLWVLFSGLHRARLAGLGLLVAVAVTASAAVGLHIDRYDVETGRARQMAARCAECIRMQVKAGANPRLWIDPRPCTKDNPLAPGMVQLVCWLRYELPDVEVTFAAGEQTVAVGDLVLTVGDVPNLLPLWREGVLRIGQVPSAIPANAPAEPQSGRLDVGRAP